MPKQKRWTPSAKYPLMPQQRYSSAEVYQCPFLERIRDLENENEQLQKQYEEMKEKYERLAFQNREVEAILDSSQKVIRDSEFIKFIPVPITRIKKMLDSGEITIKPINLWARTRGWNVDDIIKQVKDFGGIQLGFYTAEKVCSLFGWTNRTSLYNASKHKDFPKKKIINGTVMYVKEEIQDYIHGKPL